MLSGFLAACTVVIGVGVAVAINAPGSPPQPVLAGDPVPDPRPLTDLLDELVRTLPPLAGALRPSTGSAEGRAQGMSREAACAYAAEAWAAKQRLLASIPLPPGYDPTNPNGVVNIHRRLGDAPDYYADGKASGMTDDAACAYAAQAEAQPPADPVFPTVPLG